MAEQYHVDLEQFSLEKFRHILETGEVLPSRKILKEKIGMAHNQFDTFPYAPIGR